MGELRYFDLSGDNGHRRYGVLFANAIRALAKERPFLPSFHRMKEKAMARYPAYCQEIYDRAAGAGVDGELYFAGMLFGVNECESCTDLMLRRADGATLYGHNEDGDYTPENCALCRYSGARVSFVEFSAAISLPGYTFHWNDAGLVTSVNFIHLDEIRHDEPSAHFLLRDVVDACCIEEIRDRLHGKSCASAFSLNVYDRKSRRAYSIEHLHDKTDILEVDARYAHANHLLRLGTGYAGPGSDSKPRQATASRMLSALDAVASTLGDIRRILEYTDEENRLNSVYSDPAVDESPTGATMLYDSEADEILVIDRFGNRELRFTLPPV